MLIHGQARGNDEWLHDFPNLANMLPIPHTLQSALWKARLNEWNVTVSWKTILANNVHK